MPKRELPEFPMVPKRKAHLSRLLSISLILRSKEWVSGETLALRFGVSLRTIYRDIIVLQTNGVPVEAIPGPSGGYRLVGENPLPSLLFGSEEAMSLHFLGGMETPTGFRASSPSPSLDAETSSLLDRVKKRVMFDTSDWYWKTEGTDLLPTIRQAVLDNSEVELSYRLRGQTTIERFDFRPLGLVWKGGQWYIVGDRVLGSTVVRLRLNRIVSARLSGNSFERPREFELRRWWDTEIEEFGKGDTRVTLRISGPAQEEFRTLATKSTSTVEYDDHTMVLRLFVDKWDWLVPLAMSFGPDVVVEEPPELRQKLVDQFSAALRRYSLSAGALSSLPNDDARQRATRSKSAS